MPLQYVFERKVVTRMGNIRDDFEIVVAAYGESPYLEGTLRSIVKAVPLRTRVTVLDDATPDGAVENIVKTFFPRVAYHKNQKNLGVSGSFNKAMRLSRSRYTVLCGPDDILLPDAGMVYRIAVEEHDGTAVIQPGVRTIDSQGNDCDPVGDKIKRRLTPKWGEHSGKKVAESLLAGNWTYNPSLAWRTDLVDTIPFDEGLHTAMDLDRLLKVVFAGETVTVVDMPAFGYRRHEHSVSSVNSGKKRLAEELKIHARAYGEAKKRRWWKAATMAQFAPTARLNGMVAIVESDSPTAQDKAKAFSTVFRPATVDVEKKVMS